MNSFDFQQSTRVVFGTNTLDQLGELAQTLGAKRTLIVTDTGIIAAGYSERAVKNLSNRSIESVIFSNVDENPTTKHIEAGNEFAKTNGPFDSIIGLGGGSSMDCAKGINFMLTNGGKMEDYWGFNKATRPMLPSIGIPTTAGTGSEAQSYALISQETTHVKMAIGDLKARFRIVILDPILTMTAPERVTAISGIDAIGHAVETFVTKNRNPLSQMYSKEAWTLLNENFLTVIREPQNVEARSNMLLGSYFAGVAIENSMLGAAHACANPLTARFGVPHGVAVGLMLPAVIAFNESLVSHEYARLDSKLLERIKYLKKEAGLPESLREISVEKRTLPELARDAATQWTGQHNPRPLLVADFERLYQEVY